MSRKIVFRMIILLVVAGALYRFYQSKNTKQLFHVTGQTMGTITYNVKYLSDTDIDFKVQIDSILIAFNQSLSTYISSSEISALNKSGKLSMPSRLFLEVMFKSKQVYFNTNHAFDPTVGPLVNAWGFGPDKIVQVPDSAVIDSLRQLVGFEKIIFSHDSISMTQNMYLDFSAIAKGYAVDVVSDFLLLEGVKDYMVEIGGEVVAHGKNQTGDTWKIGVEDPMVGREERKLLGIVRLENKGMATSGNYRNYYTVGTKTIAHTIDPRTGYNTSHNLLSASVFASDCMTADAYATAFMVLGLDESIHIADSVGIDVFLIYQDESGVLNTYVSPGLHTFVDLNTTE